MEKSEVIQKSCFTCENIKYVLQFVIIYLLFPTVTLYIMKHALTYSKLEMIDN